MQIVMVGPFGFHPNKTMRARAFQLARPLVQRGHQVTMIMPPWQTPAEAERIWREEGVTINYVSLQGGVPGITRRMVRAALAARPGVVHCFKPKAYSGLVAWWLWQFRRHRLRLVVDSDDWEGWGGWNELAPYSPAQKHFFAWQERWGMGHCHSLTVASRALQSLAWAQGVPPAQVIYLPNGPGIDPDAGGAAARRAALGLATRPVLLLYSRLFEFDIGRLITVLQQVHAALPNLAILAVGAGLYAADAAQLRQQLATAGLLDCFVDVGWLPEGELPAALAAADAGLYLMEDTLLNRTKCPVKLADMLAVGVPVVAEAVGQVPEYVQPGQTGLLCPSGDVAGLAASLVHLLTDDAQRRRLGAGAQAHVAANFAWARLAERLEVAYGAG